MIKDFVLLWTISIICMPLSALTTPSPQRCILRVVPPRGHTTLPGLRCYYKGASYHLDDLCCVLTCDARAGLLTFVVTPCIEPVYRANRPNHWELLEGMPVRWFECKQSSAGEWIIEERRRDEVPSRIPESAFAILTNPAFIARMSAPPREISSTSSVYELPVIHFQRDLTKDAYDAGMTETVCALPDIETFHSPADAH
jgi:hypothetical protein